MIDNTRNPLVRYCLTMKLTLKQVSELTDINYDRVVEITKMNFHTEQPSVEESSTMLDRLPEGIIYTYYFFAYVDEDERYATWARRTLLIRQSLA